MIRIVAIAVVALLLGGCGKGVRVETIQPDAVLKQELTAVFRSEGHTNRLGLFHVEMITRPDRIEYSVMAKDLDQPNFTGGPSLTVTKTGENWTVVSSGSWQE